MAGVTDGVSDVDLDKITHENAMRWYSFDPFTHRAKADSTVGALRAEAGDHDVAIRAFDKGRFKKQLGADLGRAPGQSVRLISPRTGHCLSALEPTSPPPYSFFVALR